MCTQKEGVQNNRLWRALQSTLTSGLTRFMALSGCVWVHGLLLRNHILFSFRRL